MGLVLKENHWQIFNLTRTRDLGSLMCTSEISFYRGLEDGWKKAEVRLGGCCSSRIEEPGGSGLAAVALVGGDGRRKGVTTVERPNS